MDEINNVIVISDQHHGCQVGLFPRAGFRLDGGPIVHPGNAQLKILDAWDEFWSKWVPKVTRGEPFAVVNNGDSVDGAHHGAKTQLTQNYADQAKIAYEVLAPIVDKCQGRYYHIRGTEAHVGQCAEQEEQLAQRLGAIPTEHGQHSRYDLWLRVGHALCHFTHHIGVSSSHAYKTSALMRELTEILVNSALWRHEAPDIIARSHAHQNVEVKEPSANHYGIGFVTPGWQAKTPFVWKIPGGRSSEVQVGGSLIRCGDEEAYTRHFVRSLGRSIACDIPRVVNAKEPHSEA